MGYGKRAIQLLKNYYEGKFTSLNENIDESEEENGLFIDFIEVNNWV